MATVYIRPTGAGDETNIGAQVPASSSHWDKVDEVTPDDATTTVYDTSGSYTRDLYALADLVYLGTINWIKVWARCLLSSSCGAKTAIKTGGTAYDGSAFHTSGSWANSSTQYLTNPQAGGAWTWTQINALQAGVSLQSVYVKTWDYAYCTQVYVEIDYNLSRVMVVED